MRYRIPPFEMDRILRVVRREETPQGIAFHLVRVDGQAEPFVKLHLSTGTDADALMLMFDVPVFASHGLPIAADRFWPAKGEEGIWFAHLD